MRASRSRIGLAAAMAMLGGMLPLVPASTSAQTVNEVPRLAFSDLESIWIARPGDNQRRMLADTGLSDRPAWSPDGTRLVFAAKDGAGIIDLYVIDVDGDAAPMPLTASPEAESSPAWSPDGSRIAFVRDDADGGEIWIFDVAEGTELALTNTEFFNRSPAWSPDGSRIAFASGRDGQTGCKRPKPTGKCAPLAEIYTMAADGSDAQRLTEDKDRLGSRLEPDDWPAWADAGRIVYTRGDPEDYPRLRAMRSDGTGNRSILYGRGSRFGTHTQPAFSSGGAMALSTLGHCCPPTPGLSIAVADESSECVVPVHSGIGPAWEPVLSETVSVVCSDARVERSKSSVTAVLTPNEDRCSDSRAVTFERLGDNGQTRSSFDTETDERARARWNVRAEGIFVVYVPMVTDSTSDGLLICQRTRSMTTRLPAVQPNLKRVPRVLMIEHGDRHKGAWGTYDWTHASSPWTGSGLYSDAFQLVFSDPFRASAGERVRIVIGRRQHPARLLVRYWRRLENNGFAPQPVGPTHRMQFQSSENSKGYRVLQLVLPEDEGDLYLSMDLRWGSDGSESTPYGGGQLGFHARLGH